MLSLNIFSQIDFDILRDKFIIKVCYLKSSLMVKTRKVYGFTFSISVLFILDHGSLFCMKDYQIDFIYVQR